MSAAERDGDQRAVPAPIVAWRNESVMESRRAEIAREHDDHELIESSVGEEPAPRF